MTNPKTPDPHSFDCSFDVLVPVRGLHITLSKGQPEQTDLFVPLDPAFRKCPVWTGKDCAHESCVISCADDPVTWSGQHSSAEDDEAV